MLLIPFFDTVGKDIEEISPALNQFSRNYIDNVPWPQFSYKPEVSFVVAHSSEGVLLKYFVKEAAIKIAYNKINEPVYRDSCVEFFIALDDAGYYNFEFNAVGNCLGSYGEKNPARNRLDETSLQKIKFFSTINSASARPYIAWEITLMIPFEVFSHHQMTPLSGRHCKVNFYKCGDDLPEPHYICWNPIEFDVPNFHLPEFFGEAKFI